jgi:hypothetical protein
LFAIENDPKRDFFPPPERREQGFEIEPSNRAKYILRDLSRPQRFVVRMRVRDDEEARRPVAGLLVFTAIERSR